MTEAEAQQAAQTAKAAPDELTPEGLLPTGALFEAAFKRFGSRLPYYLLYAAIAGLLPLAAAAVIRAADLGGVPAGALFSFAYALGFLLLLGRLAALMTPTPNAQWPAIAVASLAAAVPLTLVAAVLPPGVIAVAWVVTPIPVAAGCGDAGGLRSIVHGGSLALRFFPRCIAVEAGLVIVGIFLWFGFGIAFSQAESGTALELSRAIVATLIFWPVAALVTRNLYGDLTGRRVVAGAVYTDPQKRRR